MDCINQSFNLMMAQVCPSFYNDVPKIHKEGAPLRSIDSSIHLVMSNIAKCLATIQVFLVGNTNLHIKTWKDFVRKVETTKVQPKETMASNNITSLFTCIPTAEAVKTTRTTSIKKPKRWKLSQNTSVLWTISWSHRTMINLCLSKLDFLQIHKKRSSRNRKVGRGKEQTEPHYIFICCRSVLKAQEDFEHNICVHFKLSNTLRQQLVHPKGYAVYAA